MFEEMEDVPMELRGDKETVLKVLKGSLFSDPDEFNYIPDTLKDDRVFMLEVIKMNPRFYTCASERRQNSVRFACMAFKTNANTLRYIPTHIRRTREFLNTVVEYT